MNDGGFGFTTAARVVLKRMPHKSEFDHLALRILSLIDSGRGQVPELLGVDVRYVDTMRDGNTLVVPIPIRTQRPQRHEARLQLAVAAIDWLREHVDQIPEIDRVEDDAAPAIATSGF